MHIAVSAPFRMLGGSLVHLDQLLRAWRRTGIDRTHAITLVTRPENLALLGGLVSPEIQVVPISSPSLRLPARAFWEQVGLPQLMRTVHPDVLLCPGNIAPWRSPVPTVVVLRNAAPFCPGVTWRSAGAATWGRFMLLGAAMRMSARTATRTIFVSRHFRDEFVRRFRFPQARGDVIYHGRDGLPAVKSDPAVLSDLGIRSPYLLSVGHLYPYKNFPALVEGYALARAVLQRHGLRLAMVGACPDESYRRYLHRLVRERDLEEWIVFTGGVPHRTIALLLAGCEWLVFQSTCENCPNTLVEALAAGVPIACSSAGVMPEIAGDGAAYFDPFQHADIARVLTALAEDPALRRDLCTRARAQAARFPTWDEVGRQTLASLELAVQGRPTLE